MGAAAHRCAQAASDLRQRPVLGEQSIDAATDAAKGTCARFQLHRILDATVAFAQAFGWVALAVWSGRRCESF